MILKYIGLRFPLLKYLLLAVLLSLFVSDPGIPYALISALGTIFFIFITLLLFRLLEDAGSIHFDIQDKERSYLSSSNFKYFLLANVTVAAMYFGFIAFIKFTYAWHLLGFYLLSALLYFLFKKSRVVVELLPFLKYPLLFFVLGVENYALLAGSALLFVTYDLLEKKEWFLFGMSSVFACGMLTVFEPSDGFSTIYVGIPLLIALIFRNHKYLKYLPIIYFPITYFIVNFLI